MLLKIQSRLEKFSQLSQQNNNNNNNSNGAQLADGPVPAKIFFKNLQQQSSLSLDKLDTVLDELFQQYQKEISSLRTTAAAATALATQSASPSTSNNTNTKTPSKASHASQESSKAQLFATPHQNKSAGSGDSPLIVPGSAISSIAPTTTKKQPGERWNEASMVMKNVSPATKEAAKLNSELLKEVSHLNFILVFFMTELLFFFSCRERNSINYKNNILNCCHYLHNKKSRSMSSSMLSRRNWVRIR